jgi:hypothetical protein
MRIYHRKDGSFIGGYVFSSACLLILLRLTTRRRRHPPKRPPPVLYVNLEHMCARTPLRTNGAANWRFRDLTSFGNGVTGLSN